ncbi:antibiotic biosynthesis monooxygenase [Pseudonocardia nigra]|uniref:antibiotic biosynthesis monooxygenase n=1 Tax=Pseudonocardia nigra TaxID=1921578 RepID=UPI001C5FC619|nr:antibiotic biosynthesis monooxygenase [Pseudonocardia nigra]
MLSAWESSPLPAGFLHLSCLLSADGEVVLTYSQWSSEEAHFAFLVPALRDPRDPRVSGVEPVRYRLYRSMRDEQQTDTPRCVITATFDVDGPERQRHIVDRLVDAAAAIGSLPGALSSHFHISTDGTRVLNYAEWTSIEDHDRAAEHAELDELYEISTQTRGVRSTRGRLYHLYGGLGR